MENSNSGIMHGNRSWMKRRLQGNGCGVSAEFVDGVIKFLDFAFSNEEFVSEDRIRCPCAECNNRKYKSRDGVQSDLYRYGFRGGYERWTSHGEPLDDTILIEEPPNIIFDDHTGMHQMVMDVAGPELDWSVDNKEQEPNKEAKDFFDLLKTAEEPLYDGCKTYTKLSAMTQLLNLKSDYNMPEACYNCMTSITKGMLPDGDCLPENFYMAKKELAKLGLSYEKIDACTNMCMLYYKETKDMQECKVCNHPRYQPSRPRARKKVPYSVIHYLPLTPRLQRLYMSGHTVRYEHMTWHTKPCEKGTMSHPVHGEAWKHFDRTHPEFASEPRNVHIGLCTNGFCPFNNFGTQYSCWPVITTVYNLPPWMCMQRPYLFLSMVIPGPKHPGKSIDVFLQPLVDELNMLWNNGVQTYDISRKENFQMKAALMWTISDFPAYAMLSGWSTHGKLACPYCMERSKAFFLKNG